MVASFCRLAAWANLEGKKVGTGAWQRFYFKDGFIDAKISQIGPFCNR